ncbi:MAG: SMC-Scp complex subunit ScpB [Clostridia bacterium]|nr:SMC-Scp complex subunit ScpB [Clostridia bacterium]
MNDAELTATLEAVLFSVGEPISLQRLSQGLQMGEDIIEHTLHILSEKYNSEESGLCLLRLDDMYQLCTKRAYADSIRSVIEVKKNAPLSQAAFEVLAIVAYNQPVTKAFIEQIRGVDCTAVITSLCQKSLIEEKGRLDLPGRPLIYGTTPEFLRCFCISSLDELPELPNNEKNEENSSNIQEDLNLEVDENEILE